MRVVSGEAKGRRLKSPKTAGTRPIIDRVKTALFDILSVRVEDVSFLDLFAGTGSVGIEALSRGAASATFIELNASMLKLVRENLQITGLADRAETLHADAFKFLQMHDVGRSQTPPSPGRRQADAPTSHDDVAPAWLRRISSQSTPSPSDPRSRPIQNYDISYVAPPQYQGLAARALALLDGSPLVPETGLVIVQIHPKERPEVLAIPLARLTQTDERRYGSTLLLFYEVTTEKATNVDTTTET